MAENSKIEVTPEKIELAKSYFDEAKPFLEKQEYRKVIELYTKAIIAFPTVGYIEARGTVYNIIGMRQKALDQFLACLDKGYNVNENLFYAGLAFRGLGQLENSLNCFSRLIELEPGEIKH